MFSYGKAQRIELSSIAYAEKDEREYVRIVVGPFPAGGIPPAALGQVIEALMRGEDLLPNGWASDPFILIRYGPEGDSVCVFVEGYMD